MFFVFLEKWRRPVLLQLFTIYLRYLIGSAFLIAAVAMGKLSGGGPLLSATGQSLCDLQPIQQFFRVMADSGLYWKFIGWTQIFAGFLLITQRYARAGALIFFGMILNIFVITISYDFKGTPVVTGLMLLATLYLLLWDAESLQYIFRRPGVAPTSSPNHDTIHQDPFWSLLGICLIICIALTMWLKISPLMVMISALFIGMAGLPVFFFAWKKIRDRHTGQMI